MQSEATDDIWLGLDVGTQSVRALAVSNLGELLASDSQPLRSTHNGPRHEQNPEHWWQAVAQACRTTLAKLPGRPLSGVAVDSTSGTILLMDRQGQPLTMGFMHDDNRAITEALRVNTVGQPVWSSLGYHMQPSWALPKLLWLLHEYHDVLNLSQGNVIVSHQTDFINHRLLGQTVATDTSSSLKMGYDLVNMRWPYEVFAQLALPTEILPNVVLSGTLLGTVCKQAAAETGIPEGTRVIAGMTDSCAAQIGAGALSIGSWNVVLGTTLAFKGVTSELIRDPAGVMYSHRSPGAGWLPGGASGTGAGVLNIYFPDRDFNALSLQAATHEPANVLAYPLASNGERFPFSRPDARRFFLGEPSDEADLFASLLQGVAYIERLSLDYLAMLGASTSGDLSLTGGGARNRYWCQLRADILGRPVRIPQNAEPALGMAILAASTGRTLSEVAQLMSRTREVISPRPGRFERFREPYIRLIDSLEQCGWLPHNIAQYTKNQAR